MGIPINQIPNASRIYLQEHLELDRCPHCQVAAPRIEGIDQGFNMKVKDGIRRFWKMYYCSKCGKIISAWAWEDGGAIEEMFPKSQDLSDSIPVKPRRFLGEAFECKASPSGCVLLCASAIDAMLKEIGLRDGRLVDRIDQAAAEHLITTEMAKWAHNVRLDANDERHADIDADPPTLDDAERCLAFASALAEYLFVLPAKVTRGISPSEK